MHHQVSSSSTILSHSVVSNSLRPHGQQPARLLCPWNIPGKNTGVGFHFLLQGIFLTQGLNPHLFESPAVAGRFSTTSTHWACIGSDSKESVCNAGAPGLIPGSGIEITLNLEK